MAASEVAVSLVIGNSLHMLSEREILSPGLHDQINTAIKHLQKILIASKLLESGTDNDQQSSDHRSGLLVRARGAVDMADKFLLEASQHLKSHKGRLAKIRALVHLILLRIRVRATKNIALDFITAVKDLSIHLSQMQDLPPCDLPNIDDNASLRNAHRGNAR